MTAVVTNIQKNRVRPFNTLFVETGAFCNRSCVFCPVHGNSRPDEWMPQTMIDKIIDELRDMKWKGRFSPFIYNEPLRDARLLNVIADVRTKVKGARVQVSTNGDFIKSSQNIMELLEAGCNQIQINVYCQKEDDEDETVKSAAVAASYRRLKVLENFVNELPAFVSRDKSIYSYCASTDRIVKVERKFDLQPGASRLGVFQLQNRSGNTDWFKKPLTEPLKKNCYRPFRTLNINWKGDAILCCNDYHGSQTFGNVGNETLQDIWNSEKFNLYRLHLQNRDRHMPLCDKCDFNGGAYLHMMNRVTFGSKKADKEKLNIQL